MPGELVAYSANHKKIAEEWSLPAVSESAKTAEGYRGKKSLRWSKMRWCAGFRLMKVPMLRRDGREDAAGSVQVGGRGGGVGFEGR